MTIALRTLLEHSQALAAQDTWYTPRVAMTAQEERQALKLLRGEAWRLVKALDEGERERHESWDEHAGDLREFLKQDEHLEAHEFVDSLVFYAGRPRVGYLRRLLDVLRELKTLQPANNLPTPLGELLPGAFMEAVEEDPGRLCELLLAPLKGMTPQESLVENLRRLSNALVQWGEAPSLTLNEAESPREDLHQELLNLLRNWHDMFYDLWENEDRETLEGLATLLRWRLERCGDILALSDAWNLSAQHYNAHAPFLEMLNLVAALSSHLLTTTKKGALVSPIPLELWDAILGSLSVLMKRLDDPHWSRTEEVYRGLLQQLRHLSEQGEPLAQELDALAWDDLRCLHPEAQRVFLEKIILSQCPELEGYLQGKA